MIAERLHGSDGLGPAGFTLASLQATMLGNRDLTAEQGRAAVVAMCSANPALVASDRRSVDVRAACAALAGWNGRGDLDARGAVLWREFIEVMDEGGVNAWLVPFDPADPTRTPRGFDAGRPAVRQAFADAVRALDDAGTPVDVRLGDFQHYAGVPIHGCDEDEGCFNNIRVDLTPGPGGAIADVSRGTSFILAVELTRAGPRARTILTYGQSANPASPHYTDQTRLYSAKKWVTARFTEAEIAGDPALTVHRLTRGESSEGGCCGGQAGEAGLGGAEQVGGAVRSLEVEVGVVVPGDADAAVHLDHFGGGPLQGLGAVELGHSG